MPTVAYLSNQFPSPVESYVVDEIRELQRGGATVVLCSARRPKAVPGEDLDALAAETLYLQPLRSRLALRAVLAFLVNLPILWKLLLRVLIQGRELPMRRLRALLHTWLGVYYALLMEDYGVGHIHIHHGYFSAWVGMVAARILDIPFSMTLHGSDLLVHAAYLDTKLEHCSFCVTISEFNRRYVLEHYPGAAGKVVVLRMGIDPGKHDLLLPQFRRAKARLMMLSVGRLHAVKDQAFLVRACSVLRDHGVVFECSIAGEGPERHRLESLIRNLRLENEVRLLGHMSQMQLAACYAAADIVVLTSRSEGIPLVLMEAMARGMPVLAPAITGIPELVLDGSNGFLYRPGSAEDFVARVELIRNSLFALAPVRQAARQHVLDHFNREKNLAAFCSFFFNHITPKQYHNEDLVLQQVQLPLQRH